MDKLIKENLHKNLLKFLKEDTLTNNFQNSIDSFDETMSLYFESQEVLLMIKKQFSSSLKQLLIDINAKLSSFGLNYSSITHTMDLPFFEIKYIIEDSDKWDEVTFEDYEDKLNGLFEYDTLKKYGISISLNDNKNYCYISISIDLNEKIFQYYGNK